MWLDRVTGQKVMSLPIAVGQGKFFTLQPINETLGVLPGSPGHLVASGIESLQPEFSRLKFDGIAPEHQAMAELLCRAIETINTATDQVSNLASPMMPSAVIDAESHLLPFEELLLIVIQKGHLHHISLYPRVDLHYEDEVTDIARVKRLAKGALVHLASHSECWQRQTLTGVIPKKALARFSDDDFNIYENRVFARLVDKMDLHLTRRLLILKDLQKNLSQALELYTATELNHRLTHEICSLWGQTFSEDETDKASQVLDETYATLIKLQGAVAALKQGPLYQKVDRRAKVGHSIHMTNILSHDSHYRHLAMLWNELAKINNHKVTTPEELYRRNCYLAHAYSNYAGLVLRHALKPYMSNKMTGEWGGLEFSLQQQGLEWQLLKNDNPKNQAKVLLTVIPWLTLSESSELEVQELTQMKDSARVIFWPDTAIKSKDLCDIKAAIPLTPLDLYCVERVGRLIDKVILSELLSAYAEKIPKIPLKILDFVANTPGNKVLITDKAGMTLTLREQINPELLNSVVALLNESNAITQAKLLIKRQTEIAALEICSVCQEKVKLEYQQPLGFKISCRSCKTERFLRKKEDNWEYEQKTNGEINFTKYGRRTFDHMN